MNAITATFALFTDLANEAITTGQDVDVTLAALTAAVFGPTPEEHDASVLALQAEQRAYNARNPNNGWDLPRGVTAQNDPLFPACYLGNSYEAGIVD